MGAVGVLLLLMVISSGFGIIKMGHVGDELETIAKEDIPLTEAITEITVNQLEQAIWFERALRFGEVLAEKQYAAEGLKQAEVKVEEHSRLVDETEKKAMELVQHAIQAAHTEEQRQEFESIGEQLETITKHHANYEHHVQQVFALIHQGKLHDAEQLAEKVEVEVVHSSQRLHTVGGLVLEGAHGSEELTGLHLVGHDPSAGSDAARRQGRLDRGPFLVASHTGKSGAKRGDRERLTRLLHGALGSQRQRFDLDRASRPIGQARAAPSAADLDTPLVEDHGARGRASAIDPQYVSRFHVRPPMAAEARPMP